MADEGVAAPHPLPELGPKPNPAEQLARLVLVEWPAFDLL